MTDTQQHAGSESSPATRSDEEQGPADEPGTATSDLAWQGVEHCRYGEWTEGLYKLSLAAEKSGSDQLPAVALAYLGYGIARFESQQAEGLELCQRAIEVELYQPEAFSLLAETHLLTGDRRSAHEAALRGLEIDPANEQLQALTVELGERRPPVIQFLPRHHAINRILGSWRHRLLGPSSLNP